MGKQIKKKSRKYYRAGKIKRVCELCGNETFTKEKVFRCKYCDHLNEVK